ncbi:MAG: beta-propeller domain-containing protein, partial [Candidatus Thermoplasmatota archaeon]|nr:beta-propeller domain-containing protein [Candidatus Thermoplasmatota archaeon]
YVRTALVVCMAATVLTAGTITYAVFRGGDDRLGDTSVLRSFSDYDELADFLEDATVAGNESKYILDSTYGAGDSTLGDSTSEHSTTNVQVSGVDEQDIVKTDGEFVFIASHDRVSIVRAYPPSEMENISVLSTADILPLKTEEMQAYISGLYLYEDKLVVLSSVYISWWLYDDETEYPDYTANRDRAFVSVFDVSDVSTPVLEFSSGVSGYLLTSRMIDDVVYLVAQTYVWMIDGDACLPQMWTEDENETFDASLIYYDADSCSKDSFVNLLAIDVSSGAHRYMSVIAGYASTIYMSPDALFITIQKWVGHVLVSDAESVPEVEDAARTTIHKVSVDGLTMVPSARGDVKGWLLNQFSMDEKDDMLRVATTTSWLEPESGVYVLDSALSVVGALECLAPTERIYAARFQGDTLYLVTFRQVDPLFVIDLSDPHSPSVLGELKIPGFSSYLHPVGSDHVLGIGRLDSQVKLSLFDVSNPVNPVEQDSYVVAEYSWSIAGYDHKSVLFDLERELLVIPMTTYDYSYVNGSYDYWSGAYVFRISIDEGISLRGMIQHEGYESYNSVERSLYIECSLYTLSRTSLLANSIVDLSEEGSLVYNADAIRW